MAGLLLLIENLNLACKANDRVTLEDNYRTLILLCYTDNALDENFFELSQKCTNTIMIMKRNWILVTIKVEII